MSKVEVAASPAFTYADPAEAVAALCDRLNPAGVEMIALSQAAGRVLAETARTDRDSPPCDVSAMDGYALRLRDLGRDRILVAGEVMIGQAPPRLPEGQALQIVTGAPIPGQAEAVVRREDVEEHGSYVTLKVDPCSIWPGQNIRQQGENGHMGRLAVNAGSVVTPATVAALAAFGYAQVRVHRKVRVGLLITGNELLPVDGTPEPWQIRDSNGPALAAMLAAPAWVEEVRVDHAQDDLTAMTDAITFLQYHCDTIFITGGVSMGDHDHVPDAVRRAGGEVIFHKLPIRPGKPVLGAVGQGGQAILGLPGNPVSVMCCARRIGAELLRRQAGCASLVETPPRVRLANPDTKTLNLWWSRPVRMNGASAALVHSMGSGDIVGTAESDGFVTIPPGEAGEGPWPYYAWEWR